MWFATILLNCIAATVHSYFSDLVDYCVEDWSSSGSLNMHFLPRISPITSMQVDTVVEIVGMYIDPPYPLRAGSR